MEWPESNLGYPTLPPTINMIIIIIFSSSGVSIEMGREMNMNNVCLLSIHNYLCSYAIYTAHNVAKRLELKTICVDQLPETKKIWEFIFVLFRPIHHFFFFFFICSQMTKYKFGVRVRLGDFQFSLGNYLSLPRFIATINSTGLNTQTNAFQNMKCDLEPPRQTEGPASGLFCHSNR